MERRTSSRKRAAEEPARAAKPRASDAEKSAPRDTVSSQYNQLHKNFLQLLLDAGAASTATALNYLKACAQNYPAEAKAARVRLSDEDAVDDHADAKLLDYIVMDLIQPRIEPLGIKVAKTRFKYDGAVWYGIVNLREEPSRLGSNLAKPQQEFFDKMVAAILATEEKAVEETDALALRLELNAGKLSIEDTTSCLRSLVAAQWLYLDGEAYALGARSALQRMYLTAPEEDE